MRAFQPNRTWAKHHIIVSGTCPIVRTRQGGTGVALGWDSRINSKMCNDCIIAATLWVKVRQRWPSIM